MRQVAPDGGPSSVSEFLRTALAQKRLSGLGALLQEIARASNAAGCILWQVAPENAARESTRSTLFVSAHWLRGGETPRSFYLPFHSAAGTAIRTGAPLALLQTRASGLNTDADDNVSGDKSLRWACSSPLDFLDGTKAALSFYEERTESSSAPFDVPQDLASLVPVLYQAIADKVSLDLMSRIHDMLRDAEAAERSTKRSVTAVFRRVCDIIAESFQCLECSIYVEDQLEARGRYELLTTTWEEPLVQAAFGTNDGVLGWVLSHGAPVRIFDVAAHHPYESSLEIEYPKLVWTDSSSLVESVRKILYARADDVLPPVSVMAAPLKIGDTVLGAIRCAAVSAAPYYFSGRDLQLLQRVSTQLSQYWVNWLSRRDAEEENKLWLALAESIAKMDTFAQTELTKNIPNEQHILAEGLGVAHAVIRGADALDVRLIDSTRNDLYIAHLYGKWLQQSDALKSRRFPLEGDSVSLGARAVQTRQVQSGDADPNFLSGTCVSATEMIVAPISSGDVVFGVLDICNMGGTPFSGHAQLIAGLLGQQLGLYHYLATLLRDLVQAQRNLTEMANQQTRIYEDLQHQLRSPIMQAHARMQAIVKEEKETGNSDSNRLRTQLLAIRGLLGKADRVSRSIKLFADLAAARAIDVTLERLAPHDLVKLIIETVIDFSSLIAPTRKLRFEVDRKSFDVLAANGITLDRALFEQAIGNLLDNAAKYSFSDTVVHVYGGLTHRGSPFVSVANKGIRLERTDAKMASERGWRSRKARLSTGEGSGIGLWMVQHIMSAHGGALVILPTDDQGNTVVTMRFRGTRSNGGPQ